MKFILYDNIYDKEIDVIAEQRNFVNHRDNLITAGIVLHDDRVIAYGAVRQIFEGLVAVDKNLPNKKRKEALQLLFDHGMIHSLKLGVDEWHVFVEDPAFKKVLIKSYGFKETKGNGLIFQFGA